MTRTRKIVGAFAGLIAIALGSLAFAMSRNAPCGTAQPLPDDTELMKAIVYRCYGGPEVLKLEDVEKPTPGDDEMLVKVRAAAVNPLDWHYMRGEPYFMRLSSGFGTPKEPRMGVDYSGTVEAVGKNVQGFKVGDEVFGGRSGAFAEYIRARADKSVVLKPDNVTFEQAASVPIAAITALQALRDHGQLKPGQKVLVNGASGGVGTFAVQIAKALGAEVTGVCSTRNVEMVRSLGADHVVDYKKDNFTEGERRYDLIVDNVGNHSMLALRHVLSDNGRYVMVGGPSDGKFFGPLTSAVKAMIVSPFIDQEFEMMLAELNKADLTLLADLMQNGKVTPVIDRIYPLSELPDAIAYLEEGHARGKVVVHLDPTASAPADTVPTDRE